jgi:hypothetical protein
MNNDYEPQASAPAGYINDIGQARPRQLLSINEGSIYRAKAVYLKRE